MGFAWHVWRQEFEKVHESPTAKRRLLAQKYDRGELRGRGRRREQLDQVVGRRNGRPPLYPIDAWIADLEVKATHQFLKHLPAGVGRVPHLDANGLRALRPHVLAQPATLQAARRLVADFYGVKEQTLIRKTTDQAIAEARERNALHGKSARFWMRLAGLIPGGGDPAEGEAAQWRRALGSLMSRST